MITVDAIGQPCPKPIMLTKKALANCSVNEYLKILVDNETSFNNVCTFLADQNIKYTYTKSINYFEIFTGENIKRERSIENKNKKNKLVIAIQKKTIGDGPEELGSLLMRSFINTLPDADIKPDVIIFINTGIFFACNNSDVIESLQKLNNNGTDLLICGTCLDYFNKKNELIVGKVSNMFEILNHLTSAAKIIYP